MNKKILIGAVLAAILIVGASCGYGSTKSTKSSSPSTPISTNSVVMSNLAFSPANITVTAGTTVTWTNNDSVNHTVTGDSGGPSSGQISGGQSYSFTYSTAGTFPYHCGDHANMTGTVTVTQ